MTSDEINATILRIIGRIAPEADLSQVKCDASWREQLDIDSIDFLNFVVALNKELQVEIPEVDYAKLSTIQGCVTYLAARINESAK